MKYLSPMMVATFLLLMVFAVGSRTIAAPAAKKTEWNKSRIEQSRGSFETRVINTDNNVKLTPLVHGFDLGSSCETSAGALEAEQCCVESECNFMAYSHTLKGEGTLEGLPVCSFHCSCLMLANGKIVTDVRREETVSACSSALQ